MKQKIVFFTASWCTACRILKPVARELASRYGIPFEEIDAEADSEAMIMNGIISLPTMIVIGKEGVMVSRTNSIISRAECEKIIKNIA